MTQPSKARLGVLHVEFDCRVRKIAAVEDAQFVRLPDVQQLTIRGVEIRPRLDSRDHDERTVGEKARSPCVQKPAAAVDHGLRSRRRIVDGMQIAQFFPEGSDPRDGALRCPDSCGIATGTENEEAISLQIEIDDGIEGEWIRLPHSPLNPGNLADVKCSSDKRPGSGQHRARPAQASRRSECHGRRFRRTVDRRSQNPTIHGGDVYRLIGRPPNIQGLRGRIRERTVRKNAKGLSAHRATRQEDERHDGEHSSDPTNAHATGWRTVGVHELPSV